MSEERGTAWPSPIIESYTLEKLPRQDDASAGEQPIARIILEGSNFFIRAVRPTVKIGDMHVLDHDITPDERKIILYLFERPPEGGRLSIRYGKGLVTTFGEPFHWE